MRIYSSYVKFYLRFLVRLLLYKSDVIFWNGIITALYSNSFIQNFCQDRSIDQFAKLKDLLTKLDEIIAAKYT